jgi:RNA polymerase sigma-70 factor (ECF subfamily)
MTSAPLPNPRRLQLEKEAAARTGGLFERHGRMVYGVCRAMLRDVHEAEDATQQVFLSAHKALLARAHVRDPGGWLATIARNECRGRIAAGMRSPLPVADEDLAAVPSPVDEQARHDQALELRDALAALPERQRQAVVLRHLYGLRYGEVATALGVSRPATEALLFRARRAMRISLRPVAAVLVVPAVIREELAFALPGFEAKGASVAAGAGMAGGLLAKLTAGSAGAKVATAAVAVSTVGAVGSVNSDRPPAARDRSAEPIEERLDPVRRTSGSDDDSGNRSRASGRSDSSDDSTRVDKRESDDREIARDSDDTSSGSGGSGHDSGEDETRDDGSSSGRGAEDPGDRSGSSGSGEGDSGHSAGSDDSNSGTSGSDDGGSGTSGSEEESEDEPAVD